jgi:nucleotide-binding universal stress UspA family protein
MFSVVVFGTDGSDTADRALPLIRKLGAAGARIVLVHADEVLMGRGIAYSRLADENELRAKVKGQMRALREEGIDAELFIVKGVNADAAHAIAEVAQDVGAEAIVVGTRGHSRLGELLVGSVTQRLLHIAQCPVIAVPPANDGDDATDETAVAATAD